MPARHARATVEGSHEREPVAVGFAGVGGDAAVASSRGRSDQLVRSGSTGKRSRAVMRRCHPGNIARITYAMFT